MSAAAADPALPAELSAIAAAVSAGDMAGATKLYAQSFYRFASANAEALILELPTLIPDDTTSHNIGGGKSRIGSFTPAKVKKFLAAVTVFRAAWGAMK